MRTSMALPEDLATSIENVLVELHRKAKAECVLLADVSGQLISRQGRVDEIDPVLVAALAAGDVAAMSELTRQIGEENPHGSFLHEGQNKSIYLFSVAGSFILIAIFGSDTPVGLMRLFVRRAAEQLHPLTSEFEDVMGQPTPQSGAEVEVDVDFGTTLADELDKAFEGL